MAKVEIHFPQHLFDEKTVMDILMQWTRTARGHEYQATFEPTGEIIDVFILAGMLSDPHMDALSQAIATVLQSQDFLLHINTNQDCIVYQGSEKLAGNWII
jgi:hypothetical protein